jgi:hypothetical protein
MYYDYFRARDAAAAASIAEEGIGKRRDVDVVSLKSFDSHVKLGKMLAFATNANWTVDTVRSTMIWPPEPGPKTPEDFDLLPEDSPWFVSDYFLEEFAQEFRDALASLSEAQLRRLETDWKPTEEFEADRYDATEALSCFRSLVDLAKRAKAANDKLFLINPAG